jgi:hypothetical protein
MPGLSVSVRHETVVLHTYSRHARGNEDLLTGPDISSSTLSREASTASATRCATTIAPLPLVPLSSARRHRTPRRRSAKLDVTAATVQATGDDVLPPPDVCRRHPLTATAPPEPSQLSMHPGCAVGAPRPVVDLHDHPGELSIAHRPRRGRPPEPGVEPRSGDSQDPTEPLDAVDVSMLGDEPEAADRIVSWAK